MRTTRLSGPVVGAGILFFVMAWHQDAFSSKEAQADVADKNNSDKLDVLVVQADADISKDSNANAHAQLLVLVLPLKAQRVDPLLVKTVDDVLASELAKRPALKITTVNDLGSLFEVEKLKDLVGCDDAACSTEIGGAIGAERILAGGLGQVGNDYVLSLRWLDAVYNRAIARVSHVITKGESGLLPGAKQAVAKLLSESTDVDETTRHRKQRPTFWTAEFSFGPSVLRAAEPYDTAFQLAAKLAWGGRAGASRLFFYGIGGVALAYFSGNVTVRSGDLDYRRLQVAPFLELRGGLPFAFRDRMRLYAGLGAGLTHEAFEGKQEAAPTRSGTLNFPEFRLFGGLWHRFWYSVSLFAGYQMRLIFRGKGADSISEMINLGTTQTSMIAHTLEMGCAFHF